MTGAILVLALALNAAGASAGFRYVAPETPLEVAPEVPSVVKQAPPEPVARGPVPIPAGPRGADPGGASADPGQAVPGPRIHGTSVSDPSVWRVHEGEMLRAALARWGARAGVDVLFLTDRHYRLEAAAAFEGRFMDSVKALFRGLSHLPHPPVAARAEGAALVVRHRLRESTQEEDLR
ncbi:MAG: TcpQ domain-containing protein [Rhodospirillales bacterium]|nr:TcpQ domain-containing protein [Rhodospirillales bacterium]